MLACVEPDAGPSDREAECHGDVSVVDQCEIRLGRHPGRQITYESASGAKRKSYSRWFLVGNRLYDVAWIAGRSQPVAIADQSVTLLLADDTARPVTVAELTKYRFTGGRDNEPALRWFIQRMRRACGDAGPDGQLVEGEDVLVHCIPMRSNRNNNISNMYA